MKTRTPSNKCSKAKTSSTKIGKEEPLVDGDDEVNEVGKEFAT